MILTSKGKKAGPAEQPAPALEPEGKKEEEVKTRYVLAAVKHIEEADVAIRTEEGTFHFLAKNGIFEVAGGPDHDATCKILQANGWKLLDVVEEEGDQAPKVQEVAPARKYGQAIRVAHPDLTEDNKPTAVLSLDVEGKAETVEMKEGVVETDDPALLRVLLEKGYRVMNPHTLEQEEEKLA